MAMSQIVRWCQGKPVLPLASFQWWTSETIMLAGDRGPELLTLLEKAGYPVAVNCVACGNPPTGLDWYNLDGVSGPCCRFSRCPKKDRP